MKKGQMCEGIVEKIKFPNKGIVKVEDSEVTVKYYSGTEGFFCHQ